jgi:hypothetical protein
VSTIEELFERNSSGSDLETENMAVGSMGDADHATLSLQKLALISPKSGCRSVSIVRSQSKAMDFSFLKSSGVQQTMSRRRYAREALCLQWHLQY